MTSPSETTSPYFLGDVALLSAVVASWWPPLTLWALLTSLTGVGVGAVTGNVASLVATVAALLTDLAGVLGLWAFTRDVASLVAVVAALLTGCTTLTWGAVGRGAIAGHVALLAAFETGTREHTVTSSRCAGSGSSANRGALTLHVAGSSALETSLCRHLKLLSFFSSLLLLLFKPVLTASLTKTHKKHTHRGYLKSDDTFTS